MKLSAIKKEDGSIQLVCGDPSVAMDGNDQLIQIEDEQDLPDAKYMPCWREVNGEIKVNLPMARAQKLEEIRQERNARLAESDKEWMIAMSSGATQQEIDAINAKKQALRDLPEAAQEGLAAKMAITTIDAYEPEWP